MNICPARAWGGVAAPHAGVAMVRAVARTYWLGNGISLPLANSMMADEATRHRVHTGINKDGDHAGIFSLAMRIAIAFSLLLSGWCLDVIGYLVQQTDAGSGQTDSAL